MNYDKTKYLTVVGEDGNELSVYGHVIKTCYE
jgi:hypothetical protein